MLFGRLTPYRHHFGVSSQLFKRCVVMSKHNNLRIFSTSPKVSEEPPFKCARSILQLLFQVEITNQTVQIVWMNSKKLGGLGVVALRFVDSMQNDLFLCLRYGLVIPERRSRRQFAFQNSFGQIFGKDQIRGAE